LLPDPDTPIPDGIQAENQPESEGPKRIFLRIEIAPVLDDALKAYAESIGLTKGAATRSLLMRLLVKRTMRAPDSLADGS